MTTHQSTHLNYFVLLFWIQDYLFTTGRIWLHSYCGFYFSCFRFYQIQKNAKRGSITIHIINQIPLIRFTRSIKNDSKSLYQYAFANVYYKLYSTSIATTLIVCRKYNSYMRKKIRPLVGHCISLTEYNHKYADCIVTICKFDYSK